jgi:hypothetical protein
MNVHALYDVFFRWFRPGRLALFYATFGIGRSTRVLDVGGGLSFWDLALSAGLAVPDVTVLNLYPPPGRLPPGVRWVIGDACALPFPDHSFDVAFSNSVVEHLGGLSRQSQFANEIRRVARGYFVQTPHRAFPVEPHLLTPFIHWLPQALRARALRRCTLWGWLTRPAREECERFLREVHLLGRRDMEALFPDSEIRVESALLLPKSLLAVKR